jgi:hypothetical protein
MAPDFPIVEIWRDYVTDEGRLARARGLLVDGELLNESGTWIERNMRIDTGAPFSILPFSLWHRYQLAWQPLGTEFYTPGGQFEPEALTWLGMPCFFGELKLRLIDEIRQRSRSLRLVAKLAMRPVAAHMENTALIGCNFLNDNSIKMTVDPAHRTNAGNLTNVVGYLTVP